MSEATVRCPKCGHKGIVVANLLNSDLLLIADSQAAEIERLRSEVERLKRLLGRDNPLECPVCGQIREANEVRCGQCTYRLDGSDGGDE